MGTPLQSLYDRFQTKVDENLTGKESLIFALVDVAISKSYKAATHGLNYVITPPTPPATISYNGSFDEDLDLDEIELLALWMVYEWDRREQQRLVKLKRDIGTSDFNRLENKKDQLQVVETTMKTTLSDIEKLIDSMNTYIY